MRKTILPLLLLLASQCIAQDEDKLLWAFPITDYMVDLNDSTKVVQIQLPEAFPVKEKQFGLIKGVYADAPKDTVEKGYGRCHLIKGEYYYFAIANNRSGVPLKKGDLLYTFIDKPAIYDGQAIKLAGHFIELDNVYDQPLFDRIAIYYRWTEADEKRMIDSAVADIKFTGQYFLKNEPSMNKLITKGIYKNQKVLNVMIKCTANQVRNFFAYAIARPRLYAGRKWKISEIFATWLAEGAPIVQKY